MPVQARTGATRFAALALALTLASCSGVHRLVPDTPVRIGRPYTVAGRTFVPADDPRYEAVGEASWYGTREQGHPTANGERFDKRRVSAAHPTLPMPSYLEVTRLDTGARMLVRVNDRGPYARDRIVDLSREAARQLGIDRAGRALVRIRRVSPTRAQQKQLRRGYPVMLASVAPSASPLGTGPTPRLPASLPILPRAAVSAPPPAVMPGAASLLIVIATPVDPDAADALASALAGEGARVEPDGGGYRVVTGPYPDAQTRAAALARLRARGYAGAMALDAPFTSSQDPDGTPRP